MIKSYALHKISDENNLSFSPLDYSQFKFGDDSIAKKFGISLADGFINSYLKSNPVNEQIVVIPSPYSFVPTATFAMKNHFVNTLNHWLSENNKPTVQEAKVSRSITYKDDYGELNAEERMKLIGNDTFQIDKYFIENKVLLFLDDIKITGTHEKMIVKMINEYNLTNETHLLYFAELINKQIHPNIENHLNYFFVKSIFDFDCIVKSGNFKFNTRVVKYILNYEFAGFTVFLQNQTHKFVEDLYYLAIGNGYHTIDAYTTNLSYIKNRLFTNSIKTINYGN